MVPVTIRTTITKYSITTVLARNLIVLVTINGCKSPTLDPSTTCERFRPALNLIVPIHLQDTKTSNIDLINIDRTRSVGLNSKIRPRRSTIFILGINHHAHWSVRCAGGCPPLSLIITIWRSDLSGGGGAR